MTPKQLRDAPHWKFFRRGQLWYDPAANMVRKILRRRPRVFIADHGNKWCATFTWSLDHPLDAKVVSTWALLT